MHCAWKAALVLRPGRFFFILSHPFADMHYRLSRGMVCGAVDFRGGLQTGAGSGIALSAASASSRAWMRRACSAWASAGMAGSQYGRGLALLVAVRCSAETGAAASAVRSAAALASTPACACAPAENSASFARARRSSWGGGVAATGAAGAGIAAVGSAGAVATWGGATVAECMSAEAGACCWALRAKAAPPSPPGWAVSGALAAGGRGCSAVFFASGLIANGAFGAGAGSDFSSRLALALPLAIASAATGSVDAADDTVAADSPAGEEAGAGLSS